MSTGRWIIYDRPWLSVCCWYCAADQQLLHTNYILFIHKVHLLQHQAWSLLVWSIFYWMLIGNGSVIGFGFKCRSEQHNWWMVYINIYRSIGPTEIVDHLQILTNLIHAFCPLLSRVVVVVVEYQSDHRSHTYSLMMKETFRIRKRFIFFYFVNNI